MTLQELIPLGTNGFFPSHGRQTMSFLVLGRTSDGSRDALLLDAGSGVGRLVEPALSHKLAQVKRLDVLLTHYHLAACGETPAWLSSSAVGSRWGAPCARVMHPSKLEHKRCSSSSARRAADGPTPPNPLGAGVCGAWRHRTASTIARIAFGGSGPTRHRRSPRSAAREFHHRLLDHVCGLPALPTALATTANSPSKDQPHPRSTEQHSPPKLVVWAPAPPLVDGDPRQALERLLSPPLFPQGLDAFLSHATLEEYSQASDLEQIPLLGDASCQPVALRRQHHPGGSVGLRFAHQLAYITDTKADEATTELIVGVDLLLHEVWVSGEQAERDQGLVQGHTDATSARKLAERAKARRFMPVHHHPSRNKKALRALHRELEGGSFELLEAVEGQSYQLAPGQQ